MADAEMTTTNLGDISGTGMAGRTSLAGSVTTHSPASRGPLLYQTVAQRIAGLIEGGIYGPNDRLPSVRQLSSQMSVSLSTVMEAYRRLEDDGWIEARPQSGYYVRKSSLSRPGNRPGRPALEIPAASRPSAGPAPVATHDLILRVMRHHNNPALVPLGAAIPNPDLLPIEKLNRAMARATRAAGAAGHLYALPPGLEALRVQIARRLVLSGCTLTPEEIVITSGCQEALNLCLRALCLPGDTVAIESPIYYGVLQAIEMQGLRALEIPTHPNEGIDLDALEHSLAKEPVKACVAIPNYSNPIGSLMSDENKKRLVEMLAERGVPLIEDDLYGDLGFFQPRPRVAKSWDTTGNVLLCSSFSKTLSPGYRVGWVVPGRLQKQVECQKAVDNLASAMPTQLAIAEFLAGGGYDHHLRKVRRIYARQTAQMAQAVACYFPPGTRVTRPAGGFVLWVELPEEINALQLFEGALRQGISLMPGPMFSAHHSYRNFIRLNSAFWSPNVEQALAKLGEMSRKGVFS